MFILKTFYYHIFFFIAHYYLHKLFFASFIVFMCDTYEGNLHQLLSS